jgi:glycosyltransferase involved in cell wall biosynthesis
LPISVPAPDEDFPRQFGPVQTVAAGREDTRFLLLRAVADPELRLQYFRDYSRGSRHASVSAPVLGDIRRAIGARPYQLIHVARLYLADTISAAADSTRRTLDLDEDDAEVWRHMARTQPPHAAAWSRAEADAEDRLLASAGRRFDRLFIATPQDRSSVTGRHAGLPVEVIENAIAFPPAPRRCDDGLTLLFVGALSYPPNRNGLLWFGRNVWPLLQQSGLPLRLRIVGQPIVAELAELGTRSGIEFSGQVNDLGPVYAEATLAIAPLHAGGGARMKVIEAAAYRVPVIATSIGARGLSFGRPDTMWLADTAPEFAAAILAAIGNADERCARADRAHALARPIHYRDGVVERLASQFSAVLASDTTKRGSR